MGDVVKLLRVGVVGAAGMLGRELLSVLERRRLPDLLAELRRVARLHVVGRAHGAEEVARGRDGFDREVGKPLAHALREPARGLEQDRLLVLEVRV